MDLAATFSGVALAISAQFGGPYWPAQVIDQAADDFDDGGSIPAGVGDPITRDCMSQIDAATEAMRQADGYAEGDVRFLILSATLMGSVGTDATVEVLDGPHAGAWLVSAIERDPMAIYYQGRGRRAPTGE
jgi:hypothetical protein